MKDKPVTRNTDFKNIISSTMDFFFKVLPASIMKKNSVGKEFMFPSCVIIMQVKTIHCIESNNIR